MANVTVPNFALALGNDTRSAVWKLTRAMKAAGWVTLSSSDGATKDTTGAYTSDKWNGTIGTGGTGAAATISTVVGGVATLTGLTGFSAGTAGQRWITISGAASGGNNGTFKILSFISSSSVTIRNAAAVAPDANNGSISWTERVPLSDTYGSTTITTASNGQTLPQATINVTSTTGFATSGTIIIITSAGPQTVTYTNTTATTFTGASGGTGTMATGSAVSTIAANSWINMQGPSVLRIPISTLAQDGYQVNIFGNNQTGTAARITAINNGLVTVSGLTNMTIGSEANVLVISGAASAANNGSFTIIKQLDENTVLISNSSGVVPDANNNSIHWQERIASFGIRGENITQTTTGAQGEVIGVNFDYLTGTAYLVVFPRNNGSGGGPFGWNGTNTITGATSGAVWTPTATPVEFIREIVIWAPIASASTTIASGSNGASLPQTTINVEATASASTTIAAGSNGQSLPQATINVASTTGFPASGTLNVTTGAGVQTVVYTGKTATTFTGASGGTGTMSTGGAVNNTGIFTNFPSSGTILIVTAAGTQTVTYTGITATTFTGASGGTGAMSTGGSITAPNLNLTGYMQCLNASTENSSRFSVLAATAGATATVAPGGGGTNNTFPIPGSYVWIGTGGSKTDARFGMITTTATMTNAQIMCADATFDVGRSADGSFTCAIGVPVNTRSYLGFAFTRVDDQEQGDVDPYIFYNPSSDTLYSPTRTALTGVYTGSTTTGQSFNAGSGTAAGTGAANSTSSCNLNTFRGWRGRGTTNDSFQNYQVGLLVNGSNTYSVGLGTACMQQNTTDIEVNTTSTVNTIVNTNSVYVGEPVWVVSAQSQSRSMKGTCRWLRCVMLGSSLDTIGGGAGVGFWFQLCNGSSTFPPFVSGPWDGSTTPSP